MNIPEYRSQVLAARLTSAAVIVLGLHVAQPVPVRYKDLPCAFTLFTTQQLASDVLAALKDRAPLAIALLHLDPSDYARVTATLRRLRRALPEQPILVGRWGEHPLTNEEGAELATMGATAIVNHPGELGAWIAPRAIDVARVLPVADPGSGSGSDPRPDSEARA